MKKYWKLTSLTLLILFVTRFGFAQDSLVNPHVKDVETFLYMHNPSGIRIEYNISTSQLEFWISPQAGKDDGYWMRNFSNRDDHTCLFDKISFPQLKYKEYVKVDYDPWHSVVHYKNQKLHIATVFDQPYVMLWFEKDDMFDVKSDKQDTIVKASNEVFHLYHPDRGLEFSFISHLNGGEFMHQLQTDKGRSTYARAYMPAGKIAYIGGELTNEPVEEMLKEASAQAVNDLLAKTYKTVDDLAANGRVVFRKHDSLQHLVDFNKSIWLSSQDHSGALHASLKPIYYLIWVREGGLACPWMGYSGWTHPLEKWLEFQMQNPTEIHNEGPGGRFFGQLVNGKITKWQEDGAFYAIWSAYTHWTQTGENTFVSGENLALLQESMQWLEEYCFDADRGLFYRQYYCETPLHNSRDFGWDNAVGKPVLGWDPAPYKGLKIEKTYDVYINLLNYSVYCMLEAMCQAQDVPNDYAAKAKSLAKNMEYMFAGDGLPSYGTCVSVDGEEVEAGPFGMDETDYQWALTCPPFYPTYVDVEKCRLLLYEDMLADKDHFFLAAYFSILGSLDLGRVNQADMKMLIDYAAKECYIPWDNIPMANSMVEMSGYYPPGHGHQIRPQMFTMGAWFGAMGNLAVRRLPFGIAMQPATLVDGVENYVYGDRLLDISFEGTGANLSFAVNGTFVEGSLQLPDDLLKEGENKVEIILTDDVEKLPFLKTSTLQLLSVTTDESVLSYNFNAKVSSNTVLIKSTKQPIVDVKTNKGKLIKHTITAMGKDHWQISFDALGEVIMKVHR